MKILFILCLVPFLISCDSNAFYSSFRDDPSINRTALTILAVTSNSSVKFQVNESCTLDIRGILCRNYGQGKRIKTTIYYSPDLKVKDLPEYEWKRYRAVSQGKDKINNSNVYFPAGYYIINYEYSKTGADHFTLFLDVKYSDFKKKDSFIKQL